jgi:hypothetical protein
MKVFSANDIRRMLDVEFISEIAIALLHGHQNKKSAIDKYYVLYEEEFEQQKDVEQTFRLVVSEIAGMLTLYPRSRWRKKSDFYSLFLVLAKFSDRMPFSSTKRRVISRRLAKFGQSVDDYLAGTAKPAKQSAVTRYADAVERAASDLANRKVRHEVLLKLLSKGLKKKQ